MRITELFDNGEFVVTAEVGPPKGIHLEHLVEEATTYLTGIHAVNVTDNQSSVMRTSTLATCVALKNAGLNPIYQATCRDRNRLALQSDLLGAAAMGIDNILCLTGDHTKMGDHPGAKPVFDLDSVSLLHTASQLEKGYDLSGNELVGEPPKFAKGAVVSPISDSIDAQLANGVEQGYGVQIEYGFCAGMVTHSGMVTGETQNVIDAQHSCAQQFRLQSDTVTVTAGQLQNGGQTRILEPVTENW